MTDDALEELFLNGLISSYQYEEVDEDGNVGKTSDFRNTERLTLAFPNGHKLIIDTICSGSSEDTSLSFTYKN